VDSDMGIGARVLRQNRRAKQATKKTARKLRQVRTNYRCSNQGLAGFACHTSTAPDSGEKQD
jgi:hypothetical protein